MKLLKKILLWFIVSFLILLSLAFMPSITSIIALIITALIAPIEKWQTFLGKYIKGGIKVIAVIALVIFMFISVPDADTQSNTDTIGTPTASSIQTTNSATETAGQTSNATAAPTTKVTTPPTTKPTVKPTIKPTPAPTTKPPHTHTFSAATCTEPKTCNCGATEGSANGHSWQDATCVKPKTCTVCNTTSGSTTSHSYVTGKCTNCSERDPNNVSEKMVWIPTNGGTKYHKKSTCSGMIDPQKVTQSEAEHQGFTPCGRCY